MLGDAQVLEQGLVSVLENRPGDCEIVVPCCDDYSDPYQLEGEVRFVSAPRHDGWLAAVNCGVEACRAPLVHVLSPGLSVTDGWTEPALLHFRDPAVAAVAPLVVDAARPQRTVAAGLAYSAGGRRRCLKKLPRLRQLAASSIDCLGPTWLAGFFRREAWAQLGGLSPLVGDEFADIDLALRLRAAGLRAVLESRSVLQAASQPERRRGYHYGLHAERLFLRNMPPGSLASLAAHGLTVAGSLLASFPHAGAMVSELAGRVVGLLELSQHRRHHVESRRLVAVALPASGNSVSERRIDPAHREAAPGESHARPGGFHAWRSTVANGP
jgi:hypothetical protein